MMIRAPCSNPCAENTRKSRRDPPHAYLRTQGPRGLRLRIRAEGPQGSEAALWGGCPPPPWYQRLTNPEEGS